MRVMVEIPEYNPEKGLVPLGVEPETIIGTKQLDSIFYVSANKAGLTSLAIHLLALAQDDVPIGRDILYGTWNWLVGGSALMLFRKIADVEHALPHISQNPSSAKSKIHEHFQRGAANHDGKDRESNESLE